MPSILLCSPIDLERDLGHTLLWRGSVDRYATTRAEEAWMLAQATRPRLVLVDRDLRGAQDLVGSLRRDPQTRNTSIAVLARGDLEPIELELMHAGANALLRLPPTPEWDERLNRLISVPARREARVTVQIVLEGTTEFEHFPCMTLNLSVRGMLLESSVALPLRGELDFVMRLPGGGDEVAGRGRVVRMASPTQYGVEFQSLRGDGVRAIRSFVEPRAA